MFEDNWGNAENDILVKRKKEHNDLQNTTQITKIEQHECHRNPVVLRQVKQFLLH